ncbi:MAG: hypothetical protein WDM81_10440 [Rhizomicrobium sp.]
MRASVHGAARALGLPATDARLIAIAGYIEPLAFGHDVNLQLAAHAAAGVADPVAAWILGLAANTVGAFDYGITCLTEASTTFREQGRLGDLARVLFARSFAQTETGDWIGALRSADESVRIAEEMGATVWIAASRIVQTKLAAMRGDFDACEAHALEVERLALAPAASFILALLQNARGIAALGAGRSAEAYAHLRRLYAPADPAFNTSLQFFGLVDFVEAAQSCGQDAAAAAAIAEIERRSAPMAVPRVG